MRLGAHLLGLLMAAAAALALGKLDPRIPVLFDPLLLALLVAAQKGAPGTALGFGVATGWTADVLGGGPFGLVGVANTVVGYGVCKLAQLLVLERALPRLALLAAAIAAQGFLVSLLLALFAPGASAVDPVRLLLRVLVLAPSAWTWTALERRVAARLARQRTAKTLPRPPLP